MKIISLLLLAASIGIAQANVYKCPGKTQGQFVYQQQACKGAKPEDHTLKIQAFDKRKITEAQKSLAKEVADIKEREQAALAPVTPAETGQGASASNPPPSTNPPASSVPPAPAPEKTPPLPPVDTSVPPKH